MARPTKLEQISKKISQGVSKLTDENIEKLAAAYAIGASDAEAAVYVDVTIRTITNWRKRNPKLFLYLDGLKEKPVLKARQEVVQGLTGNPELALKFLERKRKEEFSTRSEHTGPDGKDINGIDELRKIANAVTKLVDNNDETSTSEGDS